MSSSDSKKFKIYIQREQPFYTDDEGFIENNSKSYEITAYSENNIQVGRASLSKLQHHNIYWFDGLHVSSRYRKCGVATQIANKVIQKVQELNGEMIILHPVAWDDFDTVTDDDLRRFYQKCGFQDFTTDMATKYDIGLNHATRGPSVVETSDSISINHEFMVLMV